MDDNVYDDVATAPGLVQVAMLLATWMSRLTGGDVSWKRLRAMRLLTWMMTVGGVMMNTTWK